MKILQKSVAKKILGLAGVAVLAAPGLAGAAFGLPDNPPTTSIVDATSTTHQTDGNRAPVVPAISFAAAELDLGERTTVTATASDPDGDPMTFTWSASYGRIEGDSGRRVTYVAPPSYPVAHLDVVTVVVEDGAGNRTTRSETIDILPHGNPAVLRFRAMDPVQTGYPVRVAVDLDPGDRAIQLVELGIEYDSDFLKIIDQSPGVSGIQVRPAGEFSRVLKNSAVESQSGFGRGRIDFQAAAAAPTTTPGRVAELVFIPQKIGSTDLSFDFLPFANTETSAFPNLADRTDALGTVENLSLEIEFGREIPPETPETPTGTGDAAETPASVWLEALDPLVVGRPARFAVELDPGTAEVRTVEAGISFDPEFFLVVDADPATPGTQISVDPAFPEISKNLAADGRISIAVGRGDPAPRTRVATFTLTPLREGATRVDPVFTPGASDDPTNAFPRGDDRRDQLGGIFGLELRIPSGVAVGGGPVECVEDAEWICVSVEDFDKAPPPETGPGAWLALILAGAVGLAGVVRRRV